MARKRKRAGDAMPTSSPHASRCKRPRWRQEDRMPSNSVHPTLQLYYPTVCTLRQYLLSKLPKSAGRRRRRILTFGMAVHQDIQPSTTPGNSAGSHCQSTLKCSPQTVSMVAKVLDSTYVGVDERWGQTSDQEVESHFAAFSQQRGTNANSSAYGSNMPMSDLIDFVIWMLFHRIHRHASKPPHLLCPGFQRAHPPKSHVEDRCTVASVPGLFIHYPNENVTTLKGVAWEIVLRMLGPKGDKIMLDMLLHCGIFQSLSSDAHNLSQISGSPLSDQEPLMARLPQVTCDEGKTRPAAPDVHSLTSINFVRSRTFHARPALNAKGKVTFGLRHIHAIQRFSDWQNNYQTLHLMKYIFPRHFGLHNVFTSSVDRRETTQPFKDYSLREQEIDAQRKTLQQKKRASRAHGAWLPKRLRGEPCRLVQQLQRNNRHCSYSTLLEHYCPRRQGYVAFSASGSQSKAAQTQQRQSHAKLSSAADTVEGVYSPLDACLRKTNGQKADQEFERANESLLTSVTDLATPHAQVSAFCRIVLSSLVPDQFWGHGRQGENNKRMVMKYVDAFVRLRRFEKMSLHQVFQHLQISRVPWLAPPRCQDSKLAHSDFRKRKELFLEFLYYCFDSILIPLIRSNFHVTEVSAHQNRLFYFRHDIWRSLTEPAIAWLKLSMYQGINGNKAKRLLDSRDLGVGQVRMVPKATGLRPIVNLRRRSMKLYHGRMILQRSVNSVMTPVFNMLNLEKKRQPGVLGNALFSISDMLPKLQRFRDQISTGSGRFPANFYFAKVDVKSCFDTIPQQNALQIAESIVREQEYRIARHAEIRHVGMHRYRKDKDDPVPSRPSKKFISAARAGTDFEDFADWVAKDRFGRRKHTVFVDSVVQQPQSADKLLGLLSEHVQSNIVKFGKKYFRQKAGIPQGSVLSTLLCSLFYAEFERTYLAFLDSHDTILLRLIDDFLVISTSKEKAERFLHVMHAGVRQFGIEVNPSKSLANFDAYIDGLKLPLLPHGRQNFPYCGTLIDVKTLDISKDRDRRKESYLSDSLTVEASRLPGRSFHRKILTAFRLQTVQMLVDTTFNSVSTVLGTIYQNFCETAMKLSRYSKCLPRGGKPHLDLTVGTIRDLIDLAFGLIQAKHRSHAGPDVGGWHRVVSRRQIRWLAVQAFSHILGRKQTQYRDAIAWLDSALPSGAMNSHEVGRLQKVVDDGDAIFRGYRY